MSEPEKRTRFVWDSYKNDYVKEEYLHDNLSDIMEDGILDLESAKGKGHYEKIMEGIDKSLTYVLKDDEATKELCKKFLENPDDPIVIYETQMATTNQELRHFLCIYGYELGLKGLNN